MSIADELYDSVKGLLAEELNTTKVIGLVTRLMQSVDTYTNVSGKEKKEVILEVIDRIINDLPDGTSKDVLKTARPMIPDIIDTIISVDKRELKIRAKKMWKRCCK